MPRRKVDAQMFRDVVNDNTPLPPLEPYRRCTCGGCHECRENEKWDRIFAAKFAAREDRDVRGWFRSPLTEL